MKKILSLKYTKTIAATALLLLSFLIFFLTYQTSQQISEPRAWETDYSANAICLASGNAAIQISFTNKETDPAAGMIVTVLDNQTGKSADLGTVAPGATVTGTIDTERAVLSANTVQFQLKWADGSTDTDAKTAAYDGIECEPTVTPTVSPSETPTATPEISPSPTEEVTPSPTISSAVSTTPTSTPQPSDVPSNTPQPSYTPQPTYTPAATNTQGPSPTPTEIIIAVNNTNTPTPTGDVTAVPTIPTAGTPIAWFIILIPIAMLTLGLVL